MKIEKKKIHKRKKINICSVNVNNEFKTMKANRLNNDLYKFLFRHISMYTRIFQPTLSI